MRGRELLQVCVCVIKMEWEMRQSQSNTTDCSSIQVLPWDIIHNSDFGNCWLPISNCLLPPQRSHFTSCKSPLLLHSRVRQFSFNCPQVVKQRENHCFTQKWVNTNNCFRIPAEWSVWPDITLTVLMALSPTSAEFCSCTSPHNSHPHIPNRPSLSCHVPGKFPLQTTITCKYYKRETIQTHSKLLNQLMQRYWSQE